MSEAGIIYEIRRLGGVAKASAVDVATGIEVSVSGPAQAADATLRAAARRKLAYVLKRRDEAR